MKKVGMITIYRKNYGAFLQAYALQCALRKAGCDPEIIQYDYYHDNTLFGVYLGQKVSVGNFIKKMCVELLCCFPHKKRQEVFDSSIKKNIAESKEHYSSYEQLCKNVPVYDIYLTGSDQVFNVNISPQALKARLLCFADTGRKASYAASAGKGSIPEDYHEIFMEALSKFTFVSVREKKLSAFIKENYGVEAVQNIDPVFLLRPDEWSKFAEDTGYLKGKYIFYYRVLPQSSLQEEAKRVSKELQLPVLVADGNDRFSNQLKHKGFLSPEQWVGYLRDAAYVVTNSFHGASFVINYEKRASILVPPQGGERLINLIEKCALNVKDISGSTMDSDTENVYIESRRYLEKERKRAYEYLRSLTM